MLRLVTFAFRVVVLYSPNIGGTTIGTGDVCADVRARHAGIGGRIDHGVHVSGHEVDCAAIVGEVTFFGSTDVLGGIDKYGVGIDFFRDALCRGLAAQIGQLVFRVGQSCRHGSRGIEQVVRACKDCTRF